MRMLTLVGEQPIPNLLPVRFLKPDEVVYICTERTRIVGERLKQLTPKGRVVIVQPYRLEQISLELEKHAAGCQDLVVNLTGGTKLMAIAAYQLAAREGCRVTYLESESQSPHLLVYQAGAAGPELLQDSPLPALISLDDYLRAHLPGYHLTGFNQENGRLTPGGLFEQAIFTALKPCFDEILAGVRPEGVENQIEMDLVLRSGNRVAVAEVKLADASGKGPKSGIDQLSTAASREYLGIYTGKLLVAARRLPPPIRALATRRGVILAELPDYMPNQPLNRVESENLVRAARAAFKS